MKITTRSSSGGWPSASFFLEEAPGACDGPIGLQILNILANAAKSRFPELRYGGGCIPYLQDWNDRFGHPINTVDISNAAYAEYIPDPRKPKPDVSLPGTPLFE